jgi:hypothetical protein
MSISISRFPDHKLALLLFRGPIDAIDMLDFFGGQGAPREVAMRWLTYIDPDADLSQLDLMSITELKRTIDRRQRERAWDATFRTAIVCNSRRNDPMVNLWKGYVGHDPGHLAKPVVFSSLEGACAYLTLPVDAWAGVAQAAGLGRCAAPARGASLS